MQNSKVMQIQGGKTLTGSASNRLIFKQNTVQSIYFRFAASLAWDLLSSLHERRSKFEKIASRSVPLELVM